MVLSYNWLNPQMADTIAYGADKGMGVAVMNPVGGGMLAETTREILRMVRGARSSAEVALRFVLSTPGVMVAMSGMNTVEQVEENTRVASRREAMTARQRDEMLGRMGRFEKRSMAVCTACGYCMPCPHGVDIPGNLVLLNQARLLGLVTSAKRRFDGLRKRREGDGSALECTRCGRCLPKCPNDVPIMERLAETAELLG